MALRNKPIRSALLVPVALAVAVGLPRAQETEPPKVTPQELEQETQGTEQTPEQRIAELRVTLQKLQDELDYINSLIAKGGLTGRVKSYLDGRALNPTRIKDPNWKARPVPAAQPTPAPTPPKPEARLLSDAEKEELGADVIFTVDGVPVAKQEFDDLYDYFKSYMATADDTALKKQTVEALIVQKASHAAFQSNIEETKGKILAAKRRLDAGEDFAAVAKEMSQCPSSANGGDLGEFGRVGMDTMFAKVSFGLKPGEVSDVVQSAFGFHLIKVTGKQKGDNPGDDRVRASHILAMFDDDQMALRKVMMNARSGNIELAFVDDEWRKFKPSN